ncbi:hypothetical protein D3C73_454300 [compost metagenome]
MIKKAIIVVISALILLVAFAYLIFPTPYRYLEYKNNEVIYPIRVNVLTGKTEGLSLEIGWFEIINEAK